MLFIITLAAPTLANTKTANNQPIDLATIPDNHELTSSLLVTAGNKTFQNLNDALNASDWVKPSKDNLSAPRQYSTHWLKTLVHNSSDKPLMRWLVFEPWRLNQVDAFFLNPDTSDLAWHTATGINIPLEDRLIKNGNQRNNTKRNNACHYYYRLPITNYPRLRVGMCCVQCVKNGPAYQWCYFQQHSLQEHKRLTFQQKQKNQKPLMLTFPSQLIC